MTSPSADPVPASQDVEDTLSATERLHVLQSLIGTEADHRAMWTSELSNLARIIKYNQTERGLSLSAMGGIAYLLDSLTHSFAGKDIEELQELFATVELLSYPRTEAEADQTRRNYERLGLQVTVTPIQFPDGYLCYRVASSIDQVSKEGVKYLHGELLHSADRYPPPLTTLF